MNQSHGPPKLIFHEMIISNIQLNCTLVLIYDALKHLKTEPCDLRYFTYNLVGLITSCYRSRGRKDDYRDFGLYFMLLWVIKQ